MLVVKAQLSRLQNISVFMFSEIPDVQSFFFFLRHNKKKHQEINNGINISLDCVKRQKCLVFIGQMACDED